MDDDGYGSGVTTRPPANDDRYKYEIIGASEVSQASKMYQLLFNLVVVLLVMMK